MFVIHECVCVDSSYTTGNLVKLDLTGEDVDMY